jgi:glycylpeptide N-tetradecanoyltransferase
VEDEDHTFRFDYSRDFLKWHLTAPGHLKQWLCSVRKETDNSFIGFISAIPVHIQIDSKDVKMVEINFLCVHNKFRSFRIAPVLIKEITRRVNLQNLWQAVYTAGALIPTPYAKCKYYHRNINFKKLLDIKFTYLNPNLNLARSKKIYKLPTETCIEGLRKMEIKDCVIVHKLVNQYLEKFRVHPILSLEEVKHWFIPREKVVYSYVVEDRNTKEVTDFLSFYSLPSSVLNHEKHKTLYAAYSFFNVANSVSLKVLIKNALILANSFGFDVYNALNIMDNESVFNDLLFGVGDGSLKYYFYNYQYPEIKPEELSLVLM